MIAKRLRELRSKKAKKQHEVADYLGITRPAYTAYESGNRQPDLETVKKLAEYFETTTDYLLGKSDNSAPTDMVKESPIAFSGDTSDLNVEALERIIKEAVREAIDERDRDKDKDNQ